MGRDCKRQKSSKRNWSEAKSKPKEEWGDINEYENAGEIKDAKSIGRVCSGKVGNAFAARQNFVQENGTRLQGRRGLGKLECDLQRGLGARQVDTLREFIQGNSSGSWNNAMREEVEAVSRAM